MLTSLVKFFEILLVAIKISQKTSPGLESVVAKNLICNLLPVLVNLSSAINYRVKEKDFIPLHARYFYLELLQTKK